MKLSITIKCESSFQIGTIASLAGIVCENGEVQDGDYLWMFLQNVEAMLDFDYKNKSRLAGSGESFASNAENWESVAAYCEDISRKIRDALKQIDGQE